MKHGKSPISNTFLKKHQGLRPQNFQLINNLRRLEMSLTFSQFKNLNVGPSHYNIPHFSKFLKGERFDLKHGLF